MIVASHRLPDLLLTDHIFDLPLDYARPGAGRLSVFAREVVAPDRRQETLPWLLFLQGGPGHGAPRPTVADGWLKRALDRYRVLLLDQRGTGRSTPVLSQTLARLASPEAQAAYLRHFRADNIVRDAEQIRQSLVGPDKPWTVLGQSYGGFCLLHYLSAAPFGLRAALFTGGLPPLDRPAIDVYRATYRHVARQNARYYERYPEDQARARAIVDALQATPVVLPGGDRFTPRYFRLLGLLLGASDGFEKLHYILENAFVGPEGGRELSFVFRRQVENALNFSTHPLYAILHESIYCQGEASAWAAARAMAEFPAFELAPDRPVLFTGEMVYPWLFEDFRELQPLREAAELLAAYADWPPLYSREALAHNRVPAAAVIYYDDMYVDRDFAAATAAHIPHLAVWITNEYAHNGLRAAGDVILDRLLALLPD